MIERMSARQGAHMPRLHTCPFTLHQLITMCSLKEALGLRLCSNDRSRANMTLVDKVTFRGSRSQHLPWTLVRCRAIAGLLIALHPPRVLYQSFNTITSTAHLTALRPPIEHPLSSTSAIMTVKYSYVISSARLKTNTTIAKSTRRPTALRRRKRVETAAGLTSPPSSPRMRPASSHGGRHSTRRSTPTPLGRIWCGWGTMRRCSTLALEW